MKTNILLKFILIGIFTVWVANCGDNPFSDITLPNPTAEAKEFVGNYTGLDALFTSMELSAIAGDTVAGSIFAADGDSYGIGGDVNGNNLTFTFSRTATCDNSSEPKTGNGTATLSGTTLNISYSGTLCSLSSFSSINATMTKIS